MSFLYPAYFLVLAGLVPLLAVYLLKVRPKRRAVTALFLWEAVFDQKQNTALFHRLRDWLSLLLMILAWVATVLALTGPQWSRDGGRDLLLIVDNSASMQARDQGRTRLAAAKERAADIIRGLGPNQKAAVAALSLDLRYGSHFTSSPQALLEAVRQIEPSDCPFQAEALAALDVEALTSAPCRMILISDGCAYTADANRPIELVKIGSDQGNVGFIACDLRLLQSRPARVGLYYQLASSFTEDVTTDIVITYGPEQRPLKVIPVRVAPGINPCEIVFVDGGGAGPWRAGLDMEDALSCDNTAYLTLPVRPPIRLQVASENGFFLVHSVMAFAETGGDLAYVDKDGDVVLVSEGDVPDASHAILFGVPARAGWWGEVGPEVDDVLARVRFPGHPVLHNCDLDTLPFVGARDVTPPAGSLVLVETSQRVPLVYRVRDTQRSALVINMDAWASDFYYSAWFPVLVYNGARHLMDREEDLRSGYPVGATVQLAAVADASAPETRDTRASSYGPIRRIGFHTLPGDTDNRSLGASLFAARETLLNSRKAVDTHAPLRSGRSLSTFLASAALLLLLAECLLYHRRKVG
jgi:hypothetical protein